MGDGSRSAFVVEASGRLESMRDCFDAMRVVSEFAFPVLQSATVWLPVDDSTAAVDVRKRPNIQRCTTTQKRNQSAESIDSARP